MRNHRFFRVVAVAFAVISALVVSTVAASAAEGETFIVAEPGTPDENYDSFMAAFDAALANDDYSDAVDVVEVPAGHYFFNRLIKVDYLRNVRIVGAGRDLTVLEAVRVSDGEGGGFADRGLFAFFYISGEFEVSHLTMQVTHPHPRDLYYNGYVSPRVDEDEDGNWDPNTTALNGLLALIGRNGPYELLVEDVTFAGSSGDARKRLDGTLAGKNLLYGVVNFISHFEGEDTFRNLRFEHCADTGLEAAWAFLDSDLTIIDSTFIECFHGITAPYANESRVRISNSDFWGNTEEICVRGDLNCYSPVGFYSLTQQWTFDPPNITWGPVAETESGWFDYTRDVEVTNVTIDGVAQPDYVIDDSPPIAVATNVRAIDDDRDGSETVTLDGSGSLSPYRGDEIVEWEWSQDGELVGEGQVLDVALPVGEHTITLTVYDKRSAVGWWYSRPWPGHTEIEVEVVAPMVIEETIDDDVTITDNTVIVYGTVKGNITQHGDGDVIIANGGVVEGNIRESGPGDVQIDNQALVKGNLVERHDGHVHVDGSTIGGNIDERNHGNVELHATAQEPTLVTGNICEKGAGTINGLGNPNVEVNGRLGC